MLPMVAIRRTIRCYGLSLGAVEMEVARHYGANPDVPISPIICKRVVVSEKCVICLPIAAMTLRILAEDIIPLLSRIYGKEVTEADICTVIYFSPVDEYEL